mmetsp:Transcript_30584/g.42780  ORF Transcript_30584/g.42780 Transcript_30584/m.42780 type:complete len:204 (-) Transcript_30584:136-747(-)
MAKMDVFQRKVLLVGDASVGKTSLMTRFCKDEFTESLISTIGLDFSARTVRVQGKDVRLQVWDTAGSEKFRSITQAYFRRSHGILLVYSVADLSSFQHVEAWMRSISHYTEAENVVIKLIGSKSDLVKKRVVPKAMADELAERFGVEHIVTSAKLNHNVEECFLNLAQELVEAAEKSSGHSPRASDSLKLQTKQSLKRESSCC